MVESYAEKAAAWGYAYGAPSGKGRLRSIPEDFRVDELLGFSPDGSGEHVFLHILKRNTNTDWLARNLARVAGVRARDVSYAGLKDRSAETSQWFSVYLPGRKEPDWRELESEQIRILEVLRHGRKLRRGALQGNRFSLTIRDLMLDGGPELLEQRLAQIKSFGVPNYFGPQRFGRDFGNLNRAASLFEGEKVRDRHKRSLYLSAARSFLFNEVLSARVEARNWDRALPGECIVLAGSRSFFTTEVPDAALEQRLASGDVHPSGPLWGKGELPSRKEAAALEQSVVAAYPLFARGLAEAGMEQERRPLRLLVPDLQWELDGSCLRVDFSLPAGAFATSVLREVLDTGSVD